MKKYMILYILLHATTLHTADDDTTYYETCSGSCPSEKSIQDKTDIGEANNSETESRSYTLAKSIQDNLSRKTSMNSPKADSPRKLKPSERKRLDENYLIESAAEPSRRAVCNSPKTEKIDALHIEFDQRPLLAYNALKKSFRIITKESELQKDESLYPCSPRLTAEEIRKRYKIKD